MHGINFEALPTWQKRGFGVYWRNVDKPGQNLQTGEPCLTQRRALYSDFELPIGEEYAQASQGLLEGMDFILPVTHSPRRIRWKVREPCLLEVPPGTWQTLVFSAPAYRSTVARALARTQELLTRHAEAKTGIGHACWSDAPVLDCFPKTSVF